MQETAGKSRGMAQKGPIATTATGQGRRSGQLVHMEGLTDHTRDVQMVELHRKAAELRRGSETQEDRILGARGHLTSVDKRLDGVFTSSHRTMARPDRVTTAELEN